MSDDLIERLRNPLWAHSNAPFESPQLAKEDTEADLRAAADEIERLRIAISFWRMARYPETRPSPFDMEGRAQAQAALDLAENTLYELSKPAPSPIATAESEKP